MLASFDLEIWKQLPAGETDWKKHLPLGISCAAIRCENGQEYIFQSPPDRPMNEQEVGQIISRLLSVCQTHDIVTWNGLSFDWHMLQLEAPRDLKVAPPLLAYKHIDLMFMVMCYKGHYLSLAKAADGMKVFRKLDTVKLSNGQEVHIKGELAPMYWQRGETYAVLEYLRGDVKATLEVAKAVREGGYLRWRSDSMRPHFISTDLMTVEQCLSIPRPDTAWMGATAPKREDAYQWAVEYWQLPEENS